MTTLGQLYTGWQLIYLNKFKGLQLLLSFRGRQFITFYKFQGQQLLIRFKGKQIKFLLHQELETFVKIWKMTFFIFLVNSRIKNLDINTWLFLHNIQTCLTVLNAYCFIINMHMTFTATGQINIPPLSIFIWIL